VRKKYGFTGLDDNGQWLIVADHDKSGAGQHATWDQKVNVPWSYSIRGVYNHSVFPFPIPPI